MLISEDQECLAVPILKMMAHEFQRKLHEVQTLQRAMSTQEPVCVMNHVPLIILLEAEIEREVKEVHRVQIIQGGKEKHNHPAPKVNRIDRRHTAHHHLRRVLMEEEVQVDLIEEVVRVDRKEVQAVPAAQTERDKYYETFNLLQTNIP